MRFFSLIFNTNKSFFMYVFVDKFAISIDFKTTYFVSASYALIFFIDKIQLESFSD